MAEKQIPVTITTDSFQENASLSERELGLPIRQFVKEELVRFQRGLSRPTWASPVHRFEELRERHEKKETKRRSKKNQ